MKKKIVCITSFILLLTAFQFLLQVISGYLLTIVYTPDILSAWNQTEQLPNSAVIRGNASFLPLLFIFPAAVFAYITTRLLQKKYPN